MINDLQVILVLTFGVGMFLTGFGIGSLLVLRTIK